MDKQKTLILIDGHALAYRMFFALERTGMKTSTKMPTWAIFGFIRAIIDILKKIKPDAIAVSFDMGRKTFRTEEYQEYKAQRAAMPDALKDQMQAIIDAVAAFNIPIYMMENYEADDIIGTIATKAKTLGHKSYILTGDQDSFQLIDKEGCIKVLIPSKSELIEYDTQKVYEKLGVYPEQIVDYKALRGDVSDNIPGVKGIGEKTAAKLLGTYKTLDGVYENISDISGSVGEKLRIDKEMAYKSQFLACIKRDVDIDFDFEQAKLNLPDVAGLQAFFTKYEFYSFLRGLNDILKLFNGNDLVVTKEALPVERTDNSIVEQTQLNLFAGSDNSNEAEPLPDINYEKNLVDTKEKLEKLLIELNSQEIVGMVLAFSGNDIMTSSFCAVSFSYGSDLTVKDGRIKVLDGKNKTKTAFVPLQQADKKFFELDFLLEKLRSIFENKKIAKITHNAKFVMHVLKNHSVSLENVIFDTMIADYVKDSGLKHGLKQQALSYLKYEMKDAQELLGKGKSAVEVCSLELQNVFDYFSDDAFAVYELAKYHAKNFDEKEANLFYEIELPLTYVLYEMERAGVCVDRDYLDELNLKLADRIDKLEAQIFNIAGVSFNLNSPRQVGEILFDKLGLKHKGKNKTKTGYSTSAEVLEELAQDYEIARLLLEHRHLSKIKATYVDALPDLISPVDNRIHTTFNQTITTTGRLSSSNPNLQNIPTRTAIGNEIRGAFVPENKAESVLLAADYSQIELRLLAHYAQDPVLIEAFKKGDDIHAITASKIFGVSLPDVTKDMRRKAKAVNFGIIYGQSRYGLSEALNITPAEAQEFIDKYFETYPNIKKYMEETKYFALQNGYVETLYGRKRYFGEELSSSNRNIREFAQRAAINAPLQGSAADLIKLAMISLNKVLKDECKDAKIILQVHDELVVEVPRQYVQKVSELTIKAMELSQPLDVPLVVDLNYGDTWKETKSND